MISPSLGTPAAEVEIDDALVLRLLHEQHPDLVALPLCFLDAGWDNVIYRLGDELAMRLPRRTIGATLIEHEQIWLPRVADRLPLPVPLPLRVGVPTAGYPWRWSVIPWLDGTTADLSRPAPDQAPIFAAFLRALHEPAPADAPLNPGRGVPLHERRAAVEERMMRLDGVTTLVTPRIREIWQRALDAPIDLPPTLLHGDLHSRNILVEGGAISGIIDWGDITSGDPATDLASVWMLFDDPHVRQEALAAYGDLSQATLQRTKGWAILFGVMLLDSGLVDSPQHARMGERVLRVLDREM
jgi:aminoglycoside phosphotransferase (APT) family kinase protein